MERNSQHKNRIVLSLGARVLFLPPSMVECSEGVFCLCCPMYFFKASDTDDGCRFVWNNPYCSVRIARLFSLNLHNQHNILLLFCLLTAWEMKFISTSTLFVIILLFCGIAFAVPRETQHYTNDLDGLLEQWAVALSLGGILVSNSKIR